MNGTSTGTVGTVEDDVVADVDVATVDVVEAVDVVDATVDDELELDVDTDVVADGGGVVVGPVAGVVDVSCVNNVSVV